MLIEYIILLIIIMIFYKSMQNFYKQITLIILTMQQIRGFIQFETEYDKVLDLKNIELNENLKLAFFAETFRYEQKIKQPGVFFTGTVDKHLSSKNIIDIFKHALELPNVNNYDISIESEDAIKHLKKGDQKGYYAGIRIEPPYNFDDVCELALDLGKLSNAKDILVRTVEKKEEVPLVCIGLILDELFEKYQFDIEDQIIAQGYIQHDHVLVNFLE